MGRTRKGTKPSSFGVSKRENHDSSSFYARKLYSDRVSEKVEYIENPVPDNVLDQILCIDSQNMSILPDCSVHLMVTSPPYNVGKDYDKDFSLDEYRAFLKKVFDETHKKLVPGGRACINIANLGRSPYLPLHSYIVQDMLDIGYLMRGEILWDKGAGEGYTGGLSYATPEQDLAGRITETQDKYKDILKEVPQLDNQVGLCLLTMSGLESMESFNHPESWEAIRKAILGSDISSIAGVSDQNGLFEFREDKAKSIVRELLEKEYNEKVAVEKDSTSTYILDEEKFMGEVVTLYDRPIHCAFLRKAS